MSAVPPVDDALPAETFPGSTIPPTGIPGPGFRRLQWDQEAHRELWARICRDSFWHFCDYALGYKRRGWSWWTPRVHRPFCDWFQGHVLDWEANRGAEEPRQKHLMVCVHREFGKTMIITKAGLLWLHLRNPDVSTYIGSSTVTRAGLFFAPLKEVFQDNDPDARFSWLYGAWYSRDRTWASESLVHAARQNMARTEPSVGTWGVETGLVGMHPDVGFMDDPIDYEKMGTDVNWLSKVNSHITSLAPVFRTDSLFVYTGTRYHDADFIGEALRIEGAQTITGMPMPSCREDPKGKWHVYYRAARDEAGLPTFTENWPDWRLRDYERRNSLQYAAQLMNDPNTGAHVPLTQIQVDQLYVDKAPADLRVSVHIDTAFKSKESISRGDDTVIEVWGHTRDGSGDVYFLEGYGSNRWRVEDFNTQLVSLLQRLRRTSRWPYILTDEAEMGGKYGTWALMMQGWCNQAGIPSPNTVLLSRGGKKKVIRITTAAGYWADGKVKLLRTAPGVDRLIDQMLRIGTSPHDDWADAGADVFHSEVYAPARRHARDIQPDISRPWDRELQNGTLNSWEERLSYLDRTRKEEEEPYDFLTSGDL